MEPTTQNALSIPSTKPNGSPLGWLIEQLATLAEALGEKPLPSSQRLALCAQALCDIDQAALSQAFVHALQCCKFFPRPAELREFALGSQGDRELVEAQAAWVWIQDFMRRCWHPDLGIYSGSPKIPAATMYALRQIGGFRALSQMEIDSEPFIKKDFIVAYRLAPVAELMESQLLDLLPEKPVRQLLASKSMEQPKGETVDFSVLKQQVEEKQRIDADQSEERRLAGLKRHQAQVAWLKERGEL